MAGFVDGIHELATSSPTTLRYLIEDSQLLLTLLQRRSEKPEGFEDGDMLSERGIGPVSWC